MTDTAQGRLAAKLKQCRKDVGATQLSISALTGIPRGALAKIECGRRKVDPFELGTLADIYEKPFSYFLDGLGDPDPRPHRIAITVFTTVDNCLEDEAGILASAILRRHLWRLAGEDRTLAHTFANGETVTVRLDNIMETGRAAGNGYLWLEPTAKAFPRPAEDDQ